MEYQELWSKTTALLREDLPDVSYRTWILSSLKPFAIEGDRLYIEVVTDFAKKTIISRYQDLIANAASEIHRRPLQIEYYTPRERTELFPDVDDAPAPVANMLNGKYSFDTFVVGNSNRFAHAASLAVAEAPGDAYNPLFLYGGVGLGKTHLMHAIGHYVQQQLPSLRLAYITSENFTNELIAAIQNNKNTEFRNRFRNVDILMVDDIQFIAGRERTQEEFFHTFNALHSAGKQIIISSDKPPKEIARLEERLCSRFEWGLIADIQRPDVETRIAILRKKAELESMQVGDDVLQLIAGRIESNIRELEGSLTRVMAFASLVDRPVSVTVAEEALRDILSVRDPKRITCPVIQQAVCTYYGVELVELKGKKRAREITLPRQVAMFLTREMTDLSLPRIGDAFGGRDHTTVMHACDKISELTASTTRMGQELDDLRKSIQEK